VISANPERITDAHAGSLPRPRRSAGDGPGQKHTVSLSRKHARRPPTVGAAGSSAPGRVPSLTSSTTANCRSRTSPITLLRGSPAANRPGHRFLRLSMTRARRKRSSPIFRAPSSPTLLSARRCRSGVSSCSYRSGSELAREPSDNFRPLILTGVPVAELFLPANLRHDRA